MNIQLNVEQLRTWANNAADPSQAAQFSTDNQEVDLQQRDVLTRLLAANAEAPVSMTIGNRTQATAHTNEVARQVFLDYVLKECDAQSKDDLPDNVKTAMKLDSWLLWQRDDWTAGKSRPLTARRVKAVLTAVDEFKRARQAPVAQQNQVPQANNAPQVNQEPKKPGLTVSYLLSNVDKEHDFVVDFWDKLPQGLRTRLENENRRDDYHVLRIVYNNAPTTDGVKEFAVQIAKITTEYEQHPNGRLKLVKDRDTGVYNATIVED